MGSSLIITLREGLEASLIIAILLTYLRKTGRQSDSRAVWFGTGLATLVCLLAGALINVLIDGLHGKVEQAVEGFIARRRGCAHVHDLLDEFPFLDAELGKVIALPVPHYLRSLCRGSS